MKVVILAGGLGTRLSEYTESIPKPMVTIGGKPILWHIMNTYAKFSHKDFYIAAGYKSALIKDYFLKYRELNSDFTIDLSNGNILSHQQDIVDWKVTIVDTGLLSMTGGRLKRMKEYIGNEPFLLTYGDGLSNIDINAAIQFHQSHGKMVTVSAVHPGARFGELDIKKDIISSFKEKPQVTQGWINGGYFIVEPEFFDLINNDETILEKEPLEKVAKMGELMPYKHKDFWHCMDTKRDRDSLEELWLHNNAPWS
jgi:glucose-1-phosphate cytidylyltransferase